MSGGRTRSVVAASIGLVAALLVLPVHGPAAAAPAGGPTARYLVQVAPGAGDVDTVVRRAVGPLGGTVEQVFSAAIHGGVVTLPAALAPALALAPGVVTIEPDRVVRLEATQSGARWGLDRIDQRGGALDRRFSYTRTGAGVDAYVFDTGIRFNHQEFQGRAVRGFDAFGGTGADCNGHGTHVAGALGGARYGVAKGARLIAVRVLDCDGNGSLSGVIAGIDWVIRHHAARPAVANLSLSGATSSTLDTAVRRLISDRVTVVTAAGNTSADACAASPGRVSEALTVAASDINDALARFSNGGSCVDLAAPGVDIIAAWHTGTTATERLSGTSMAAPHVAGAAARYLQGRPDASPATVASALVSTATTGRLTGTGASCLLLILDCREATPNRLLYVAPGG